MPVVEALRLGLEPLVDLLLRAELLRDVARLVHQIEDRAVLHGLAELIGVDVPAEHLEARLTVLLEQRCPREADEDGTGQEDLHRLVQLAGLRAVALVHEHEQFPYGRAGLLLQLFNEGVEVVDTPVTELVHQRTEQPRPGLAELGHQIRAALRAGDCLATPAEDPLDLLVQLVAVGHDEDAGLGQVL